MLLVNILTEKNIDGEDNWHLDHRRVLYVLALCFASRTIVTRPSKKLHYEQPRTQPVGKKTCLHNIQMCCGPKSIW